MTLRGSLRAPSADRQPDATAPDSTTEDRQALDELFSLAYEELRRLASSVKRGDPSVTLSSTALVNEAWLKLVKSPGIKAASHLHFKRIAARAMRQLLVEAARRRNSRKRGGSGNVFFVSFDESFHGGVPGKGTLLALDMALTELARLAPRQAQIVEYRFFSKSRKFRTFLTCPRPRFCATGGRPKPGWATPSEVTTLQATHTQVGNTKNYR